MWLLRPHLIEPRDYNRIDRIVAKSGFVTKRYSTMVLVRGILLHVLQGKSWRQVGAELRVPYLPIYHFATYMHGRVEEVSCIEYCISRRIALSVASERHITLEYLDSDEIVEQSLLEYHRTRSVSIEGK